MNAARRAAAAAAIVVTGLGTGTGIASADSVNTITASNTTVGGGLGDTTGGDITITSSNTSNIGNGNAVLSGNNVAFQFILSAGALPAGVSIRGFTSTNADQQTASINILRSLGP